MTHMLCRPDIPREQRKLPRSDAAAREQPRLPDGATISRSDLSERAAALLKVRRLRNELFGRALFGEPAWDMLLALYVATGRGTRVTVSGIAGSECPHTTGLRWLQALEAEQLVKRVRNCRDKRMSFVELTPQALNALDRLFYDVSII